MGHGEVKTTIRISTCVQQPLKSSEQKNVKHFKSIEKNHCDCCVENRYNGDKRR